MFSPLLLIMMQIGVEAGGAQVSCDSSSVTLWAWPENPPANYTVSWEGASVPGVFLVVNPAQTTSYTVTLTDLDSTLTYQDTTRVLVHPGNSDLNGSGSADTGDWLTLYSRWGRPPTLADDDPDGDGRVSILDWFFICNFEVFPPNTPPSLSVAETFTVSGDTVEVAYQLDDMETMPSLHIGSQPGNGFVSLISGVVRYAPDLDFVGTDSFTLYASDGFVVTPEVTALVQVLEPDNYEDIRAAIFWPNCRACHLEGVVSGGLNLDNYANALAGGDSGAGFVAGQPGSSPIYLRTADGSMPLGMKPLDILEIERIRLWILRGALQ